MNSKSENYLLEHFAELKVVGDLKSAVEKLSAEHNILTVSPFAGSSKSIIVKLLPRQNNILILHSDRKEALERAAELNILGCKNVVSFDNFEREEIQKNISAISSNKFSIVAATYEILKLKLPSKKEVKNNIAKIEPGGELDYDELLEYLNLIEYRRDKYVDIPGAYSIRGSIIDFWSYSESYPVRVEFDGDFLESIRTFEPETQRSTGIIDSTTLSAKIDAAENSGIFEHLTNPLVFAQEDLLTPLFEDEIKSESVFKSDAELDEELKRELFDDEAEIIEKSPQNGGNKFFKLNRDELFAEDARWIIERNFKGNDRFELDLYEAPPVNSNFEILFNRLKNYVDKGYEIIITAENEIQGKRLGELLTEFKPQLGEYLERRKIKIFVLPIKTGFVNKQAKLAVYSDYQIFNKPYRTKIIRNKNYKKSRAKDLASIKKGDYVVHENFGIGRFVGLENIKIGMVEQECIKIQFAEGGVVYVNLNYLSLVKKFSSKDNAQPRLSVLGSGEWKKTKKKVKGKIKDAARKLIELYAERKSVSGITYSPDTVWQKELEASFRYEDTPDQARVTGEVKEDMESENPMDRLVCGDVGFGKTEIAVRAAFKAVNDGKQVGVLVPTTILAEQHYNTFKDRLSSYPVKVESLSRFQKKKRQTEIVEELSKGIVDIVVGTHRLLSKDIKFKDLGLLIIDEEHRFGVMSKEKLRSLKADVDTLTLTATPIPRTLNMSLLGARDLSIIATPPPNRMPIYTKVEVFDIHKIREWVLAEIRRGGQVYFVHDRVQSIEKIASYLIRHIPEAAVDIAHGQMKPAQLENVIHNFLNKKSNILLSTKIIESGIDIPNVNTIIINRADRFGLAELHQLRGRVGRSDRQAYAYLLVPSMNTITSKAVKRLQAIEEYTDLGEGFNLSMRDLEIRGAGNLLGTEQSGVIDSVGFDLYMKLLDETVNELKSGEFRNEFKELPKFVERSEPTIDAYFQIGIPESFMPEQSDRLSFYTALFTVLKEEEIDEAVEELKDRFGKPPLIIERLILTARLRYYASLALFERIIIKRDEIQMFLPKAENEEFYKNKFQPLMNFIIAEYPNTVQFKQGKNVMKLAMINDCRSPEEAIKKSIKFCREMQKYVSE